LLISGQSETALDNLRILTHYSKMQHGRVPHEITPSGRLFNAGNTVETPEFVTSAERAYRWTGNFDFLSEVYDLCRLGLFEYVLGECDPTGDMLPDGAGLLELSNAEFGKKLDVACSLYQALHSLAYLAEVLKDEATAEKSSAVARQVQQKIEKHFWIESRQEYAWKIESDLSLNPTEPAHSYAVLEMGVLEDKERAKRLFERVEGPEHTGPKGIIHPGTKDFVMPIQNAILAQAEFRYGRPDKGLWYLERMSELCGYYMPWAIPEFVGNNACFIQAWSSAAFNWLIVQGFFRMNPDPIRNVVQVQPQLPQGWDFLEIKNLNIWEGRYDLQLKRVKSEIEFTYQERVPSPRSPSFELSPPSFPASFV
jgi:glycogen debranching enzyme